jgi:hypothetical protein
MDPHATQLNLLLGQQSVRVRPWVLRAGQED